MSFNVGDGLIVPEAIEKYSNLKTAGKVLLLLIAFLAGGLVLGILLLFLASIYFTALYGNDPQRVMDSTLASMRTIWFNFPAIILQELLMVGIAALFVLLIERKKSPLRALGLRPIQGKHFLAGMALGVLLAFVTLALSAFTGIIAYDGTGVSRSGPAPVALSFAALLLMTFFVGFGEETFFRGCLQTLLVDKYGVVPGLMASSVIFTLLHISNSMSLVYVLLVFAAALALGTLFIVTRSLYVSIGFHFLWDFLIINVFPMGPSEIDTGAYPVFVFSIPKEIVVGGIGLGRGYEGMAAILLIILLGALYVYQKRLQR